MKSKTLFNEKRVFLDSKNTTPIAPEIIELIEYDENSFCKPIFYTFLWKRV